MQSLCSIILVLLSTVWAHPLDAPGKAAPQPMSPTVAHRTNTPQHISSISPATTFKAEHIALENRASREYANTCGYFANGGDPVTCGRSSACYKLPEKSVQGCCHTSESSSGCTIPTTCVPYSIYGRCTSCNVNSLAVTCSNTASPYCLERWYSYEMSSTLTEYVCGTSPYSSWVSATTKSSATGESESPTSSTTSEPPVGGTPSSGSDFSTTATATGGPQPTSNPGGSPSDQMPTDFNAGAAAGGAVGGSVIIAILTFWFLSRLRRRRKMESMATGEALSKEKHKSPPSSTASSSSPTSSTVTSSSEEVLAAPRQQIDTALPSTDSSNHAMPAS